MKTKNISEELFKALENIYTQYTLQNEKVVDFVSSGVSVTNIKKQGFCLFPYINDNDKGAISFQCNSGGFFITSDNVSFFVNGEHPIVIKSYLNLTEAEHFQLSTHNYLAGSFEFSDLKKIYNYFEKIIL